MEAKEITPDGVAAAAAALAAHYRYIKAPENPVDSFWFFFDKIYEDIESVVEHLALETERVKNCQIGREVWELMDKEVLNQLSQNVYLRLKRRYCVYGEFQKPLEELSDDELRSVEGIGRRTLAKIRSVIPYKDNKEDKL